MKLIQRDLYLDELKKLINTPDIKVITGIRRSGKSKLLESFIDYVKTMDNVNIIHINYNLERSEIIQEYHELLSYVKMHYAENKKNYVFIDEVQMCPNFEKAIISLHTEEKYDIYITGSNAFLLSSDLATLFTGRTMEIEVFPFSFKEFIQYYGIEDIQEGLDRYIFEGGLSGSYVYNDKKEKTKYVKSVFETLLLRDIITKYKIRRKDIFLKLSTFLIDNISNTVSPRKISATLNSNSEKTNSVSVSNYLDYLCKSYAFYKIRRYDIKGKKYLTSNDKYYLSDSSFKYALLGNKNLDTGRTLENIVAIELLRRGYEVYTGQLYNAEIDFVAIKPDEKIYIQVAEDISNLDTKEREIKPLKAIRDAYPKIVLARTKHMDEDIDGIRVIDLAKWLKENN